MGKRDFWSEVFGEVLIQRDWQEYADACLTNDPGEPVVAHAAELAASDH
jgi:hypothetical protein